MNADLRMQDALARATETEQFLGSERLAVEVDRVGGTVNHHMGDYGVAVVLWSGGCGHGNCLLGWLTATSDHEGRS
ncbi:hypothetical protein OIE49_24160 [Streptomyces sp. NBC_01788]|uniref:hypothetical protein n=1 Tax=Streptomyces sp. NBC_01788 TaxID=2975940 RepID=UPI002DDA4DC0|nr:hypothetical protein [Streptomyces sp. NBC_01788]WSB28740.1 hypothetical protein OIE49_24160 [Streptomyces sp. NBC_01788]